LLKKAIYFINKERNMTNQEKTVKTKTGIPSPAKQLGNVWQACKVMGYSRDSYYQFKNLYETGGEAAFRKISRRKPNVKNRAEGDAGQAEADSAHERPA
jgi:ACT domain-containing protein